MEGLGRLSIERRSKHKSPRVAGECSDGDCPGGLEPEGLTTGAGMSDLYMMGVGCLPVGLAMNAYWRQGTPRIWKQWESYINLSTQKLKPNGWD